jgi:hypothetical protein
VSTFYGVQAKQREISGVRLLDSKTFEFVIKSDGSEPPRQITPC